MKFEMAIRYCFNTSFETDLTAFALHNHSFTTQKRDLAYYTISKTVLTENVFKRTYFR